MGIMFAPMPANTAQRSPSAMNHPSSHVTDGGGPTIPSRNLIQHEKDSTAEGNKDEESTASELWLNWLVPSNQDHHIVPTRYSTPSLPLSLSDTSALVPSVVGYSAGRAKRGSMIATEMLCQLPPECQTTTQLDSSIWMNTAVDQLVPENTNPLEDSMVDLSSTVTPSTTTTDLNKDPDVCHYRRNSGFWKRRASFAALLDAVKMVTSEVEQEAKKQKALACQPITEENAERETTDTTTTMSGSPRILGLISIPSSPSSFTADWTLIARQGNQVAESPTTISELSMDGSIASTSDMLLEEESRPKKQRRKRGPLRSEAERKQRKLESNRRAAIKFRGKKKQVEDGLLARIALLEKQNQCMIDRLMIIAEIQWKS